MQSRTRYVRKVAFSENPHMPPIYDPALEEIMLHAAPQYPTDPEQLRGMTIAGFRVMQNAADLNVIEMRSDAFRFLLTPTTLSYWKRKNWLEPQGRAEYVRLTTSGLTVCSNSLINRAATNTTEATVQQWTTRMLNGDTLATETRIFQLPLTRST